MKYLSAKILCTTILWFFIKNGSDNELLKKGTLVIAGCASDGVVIASDSRITDVNKGANGNLEVISYVEEYQKIFTVKGIPIANTGQFNFGKYAFHQAVENYNKNRTLKDQSAQSVFGDFINTIKNTFPEANYPYLKKNKLFSGYFKDNTAYVLEGTINDASWKTKTVLYSDSDAESVLKKNYKGKSMDKLLTCRELEQIFEQTIIDFAKENKFVGGPVSIIRINRDNSISYIKNDFSKKPLGNGKIHVIPEKEKEVWNKQLKKTYP